MKRNKQKVIVACDVDGTLVRLVPEGTTNSIQIVSPYSGTPRYYVVHNEHVELLRQYKGRGFYNHVWSANGEEHAYSVVVALGLDDGTVDETSAKPMKHIDDKSDVASVTGAHVFIPEEGFDVI